MYYKFEMQTIITVMLAVGVPHQMFFFSVLSQRITEIFLHKL